jgi:hypothetical protein
MRQIPRSPTAVRRLVLPSTRLTENGVPYRTVTLGTRFSRIRSHYSGELDTALTTVLEARPRRWSRYQEPAQRKFGDVAHTSCYFPNGFIVT